MAKVFADQMDMLKVLGVHIHSVPPYLCLLENVRALRALVFTCLGACVEDQKGIAAHRVAQACSHAQRARQTVVCVA